MGDRLFRNTPHRSPCYPGQDAGLILSLAASISHRQMRELFLCAVSAYSAAWHPDTIRERFENITQSTWSLCQAVRVARLIYEHRALLNYDGCLGPIGANTFLRYRGCVEAPGHAPLIPAYIGACECCKQCGCGPSGTRN